MSNSEVCRVLEIVRHERALPQREPSPAESPRSARAAASRPPRQGTQSQGDPDLERSAPRRSARRRAGGGRAGLQPLSLEGPTAEIRDAQVRRPAPSNSSGVPWSACGPGCTRAHERHSHATEPPHAAAVVDLVADRGLPRLTMNLVIPCGTAGGDPALAVPYADISSHVLRLRDRAQERGVELIWSSPLPMCLFDAVAHGLGNRGSATADGSFTSAPPATSCPARASPTARAWPTSCRSPSRRSGVAQGFASSAPRR